MDQIKESEPSQIVEINFSGPIFAWENDSMKLYILIMTSVATTALHLEIVSSLDIEAFWRAFKRFIARRGVPNVVYSENALTFKRASEDLTCLCKQ